MSYGKCLIFCTIFFVCAPSWGDDLADDVVSGWEFQGVFGEERSIISEDFLIQNQWLEPVFKELGESRDIAAVDTEGEILVSELTPGRLAVVEEIPYSYPWLRRWQVYKRRRPKKSKKKKP